MPARPLSFWFRPALLAILVSSLSASPAEAKLLCFLQGLKASIVKPVLEGPSDRATEQTFRRNFVRSIVKNNLIDNPSAQARFSDDLMKSINYDAAQNRKQIIAKGRAKFDVVIVGNGVHGTIAALNLPPWLSVLVIDAGHRPGETFAKFRTSFPINSPELENTTANLFPNGAVQVKELSTERFVKPETLGNTILYNYYASNVSSLLDVSLQAKDVSFIERANGKIGSVIRLNLDGKPVEVQVNKQLLFSTGLGVPEAKFTDANTLNLIAREGSKPFSEKGIILFDDAMVEDGRLKNMQSSLHELYPDEEVAVVGSGDSANGLVEELLRDGGPKRIHWVRQKATTTEEFNKANKARYHTTLGPRINDPKFVMNPNHCTEIIEYPAVDGKKRFGLTTTSENGGQQTRMVNHVFITTGYENILYKDLSGSGYELVDVHGAVDGIGPDTVLSKRLTRNGKALPAQMIGPGGGKLATEDEIKQTITRNAVSINVTGPRTAAAAALIH